MPRSMPLHLFIVAIAACIAMNGCTKYEYVITQPPEFAGRLTRQERVLDAGSVIFHLVDQNSRLAIRIENVTDDSLTIKGEDSYVVTPDGRSDPMRGGTIAAHTWAGLTVPPLVRTYERSGGVSFGIGAGSWGHSSYGGVGVGYSPYDDDVYLPRDEVAWRWKDGAVRIHIVIDAPSGHVPRQEHDFTIERRRIE